MIITAKLDAPNSAGISQKANSKILHSPSLAPPSHLQPRVNFNALPDELLAIIMGEMDVGHVQNTWCVSKALNASIAHFWKRSSVKSLRMWVAEAIDATLPSDFSDFSGGDVEWCRLLRFLSTTRRHELEKQASIKQEQLLKVTERGQSLGIKAARALVSHLKCLDKAQREQIANAIIDGKYGDNGITALCEGSENIGLLNEAQRVRVVGIALKPSSMTERFLIGTLAPGLSYFSVDQRAGLFQKALSREDALVRPLVIGRLGAHAANLNEDQRKELFGAILDFSSEFDQSLSVHHLGAGLQYLNEDARHRLIQTVLNMQAPAQAIAISGLGAALAFINEDDREQLLAIALNKLTGKAQSSAVAGMAAGLGHMSEAQHAGLVKCVCGMEEERFKAQVMEKLGDGMAHLNVTHREQIASAALRMKSQTCVAQSIRGLGRALAYFSLQNCTDLLAAADGLPGGPQRQEAWVGLAVGLDCMSLSRLSELAAYWISRQKMQDASRTAGSLSM